MKSLKINVLNEGKIKVIVVSGFMDMSEVPKFEAAIEGLIKSGSLQIVLDLTNLEYISSAGLGEIIGRIREVRRQGGDIKVGGYSDLVYEILETFGFTAVFETFPSREKAMQKFEA